MTQARYYDVEFMICTGYSYTVKATSKEEAEEKAVRECSADLERAQQTSDHEIDCVEARPSETPIIAARALIPFWMQEIQSCDGLEIHPVRDGHWNEETQGPRPFSQDNDLETWCEPCAPEEAHFWSVYGHLKTGGVLCLEDFATEAEARRFAERLLAAYPHLRKYGLWG